VELWRIDYPLPRQAGGEDDKELTSASAGGLNFGFSRRDGYDSE
jgi:hypothetical protein